LNAARQDRSLAKQSARSGSQKAVKSATCRTSIATTARPRPTSPARRHLARSAPSPETRYSATVRSRASTSVILHDRAARQEEAASARNDGGRNKASLHRHGCNSTSWMRRNSPPTWRSPGRHNRDWRVRPARSRLPRSPVVRRAKRQGSDDSDAYALPRQKSRWGLPQVYSLATRLQRPVR
jgi:hypothetical protein